MARREWRSGACTGPDAQERAPCATASERLPAAATALHALAEGPGAAALARSATPGSRRSVACSCDGSRGVVSAMRVLVAGATGLIGSVLWESLGDDHSLEGIDLHKDRARGIRRVDVRRARAIRRALEGVDAVVDLATGSDV